MTTIKNMTQYQNIFLLAGRTGGPLIPLLAISKSLPEFNPIIIGVKNGFETKIAKQENLEIEYLPEAKLNILSFKKQKFAEILLGILDLIKTLFLLVFSFGKCIYLLLKYQPSGILSSGSFLAVPIIFAAVFLKKLGLIETKIIIHQQDPLPGLANKLTIRLADLKSCVFEYTKINFKNFKDCQIIPNPIDIQKFEAAKIENIENPKLKEFFQPPLIKEVPLRAEDYFNHPAAKAASLFVKESSSTKPIFLIFGGGSGAKIINDWVSSNLEKLLEHFRIIHLTGELQGNPQSTSLTAPLLKEPEKNTFFSKESTCRADDFSVYLPLPSLIHDMPAALKFSDVVMCRAGLGSITELQYLNKVAILVPIPNSHQELNAELVKNNFTILEQTNISDWINVINAQILTKMGKNTSFFDGFSTKNSTKKELEAFYNQARSVLVRSS